MRGKGFEPQSDVLASLRTTSLLRIPSEPIPAARELLAAGMRGKGFEPSNLYRSGS